MRDVLPPEAGQMRALETALLQRFAAYGYGEVRTPWLEFAETLELPEDDTLEAGYRLTDEQGRQLMVRTDMTVPIARVAAARYEDAPLPLRFCYVAPSIRPWAPQRSQDGEFVQAGVELLGLATAAADAECVTLLGDALSALGLRDFKIALGTVAFSTALVDSLGLSGHDRESLLEALADRDYPLLETIAGNVGVGDDARKALQRMLELSGTPDSLTQARRLASTPAMDAAIVHLVQIRDLVAAAGYGEHVTFDFGLFQDLSYYTSLIFEVYAPGSGLPIASGGRYDGLVARLGWDIPGVGFAIALDRLEDALEAAGALPKAAPATIAFVGGLGEPQRVAELRAAGWAVAAFPDAAAPPPLPRLRREGGGYYLETVDGKVVSGGWREVLASLGSA